MRSNSYRFFQNRECKFFPCHEVQDEDDFNCLFCYCPLYLDDNCIGSPGIYHNRAGTADKGLQLVPGGSQSGDVR